LLKSTKKKGDFGARIEQKGKKRKNLFELGKGVFVGGKARVQGDRISRKGKLKTRQGITKCALLIRGKKSLIGRRNAIKKKKRGKKGP